MSKFQNSLLLKTLVFTIGSVMSLLLFGKELGALFHLVNNESEYTHLAVIPLVSGFFLWSGRKKFLSEEGCILWGTVLIVCGTIHTLVLNEIKFEDSVTGLTLRAIGIILVICGLFILCWGFKGFKQSLFPFIFLLIAIPFPLKVLNSVIVFLQHGSAVMVEWLYVLLGQNFVRDDVMFHLDALSITIAPQCSGIRSTMALIITGGVAVEMFLINWWNKTLMLLIIVPLSLLKNAIRIVTITMLAQYVDMAFLTHSKLHSSGGIVFYLIVLAIYFPLLFLLSKIELKQKVTTGSNSN